MVSVYTAKEIINRLLEYASGDTRKAGRLFERFVEQFLKKHNYWGNLFKD